MSFWIWITGAALACVVWAAMAGWYRERYRNLAIRMSSVRTLHQASFDTDEDQLVCVWDREPWPCRTDEVAR